MMRVYRRTPSGREAVKRVKAKRRVGHGVEVVRVLSTTCAICLAPLTDEVFPHPLATTIGHEPPLVVVRRLSLTRVVERPEHWECNRAKGVKTDAEMRAA